MHRWISNHPITRRQVGARKATRGAIELISSVFLNNPFETPANISVLIRNALDVHLGTSTVRFLMKRLGLTYKKASRFVSTAAVNEKRLAYSTDLSPLFDPDRVVSIDESCFYFDMKPARGYCHRSSRLKVPARPGGRMRCSILMAVTNDRVVGWKLVQGSINSAIFADFMATLETDERDVILLDNASIHKTQLVLDTILSRGLTPCFLPPYTPDFQPIEHCFSVIKNAYKRQPARNHADTDDATSEADRPKLHRGAGRGGVFVPLNALKRRFVMLDATDLSEILGAGENVDGSLRAGFVRDTLKDNIRRVFGDEYVPKEDGTPSTWLFTGTCDTDGDEIKMHFQRPLRPSERKQKKDDDETAASPVPAGEGELGEPAAAVDAAPERLAKPPRLLLLVDPGRVNLATITVMLDGKVVTRPAWGRTLLRPLKYTFSCRQYYTLVGERRRAAVQKQRERASDAREERDGKDGQKALRTRLSATTLRTGRADRVLAYMRASLELADASEQVWGRALGKATAACRRRRQMAKDACILRWFCGVRRSVKAVTGLTEATVVWGVKIAPTGRGNLSAPTDRVALLAARVEGWTVVAGDEYRTSKASCVPPHVDNLAPRFRGQTVVRCKRRPDSFRARVRGGFVLGLDARRTVRRGE